MSRKVKKDDLVYVLTGKDKGVRGRVLKVFPVKNKAIVESVNFIKKHQKKRGPRDQQQGIIQKEAPVDISNLMVVNPKSDQPERVGFRMDADGGKVRISKRSENPLE